MMICLSLVASLIDAIFDIDWCCLLCFSHVMFFSFCSRNHQNDTASVSRDCLHKSQRSCHIQRWSFNGYMIHTIKQASRVVFLKLLGIAELIWDQRCSHMTDLLSTVWYLMHSRSVSRFRCLLSSRRDRVTLRVCMATLHWQAESAGCQHLWQLGNQGQGSSLSDPQLPAALHHTHTSILYSDRPLDCPPPSSSKPYFCWWLHLFKRWLNLQGYGVWGGTYQTEQIVLALKCADKRRKQRQGPARASSPCVACSLHNSMRVTQK